MGAKLVKNTTDGAIYCTSDTDCYGENTYWNEAKATTDAEKKLRCCGKYLMIYAGTATSAKSTVDTLYT